MGKRINRTVIVTGASSGIGEVTVLHLAKLGYVVAATSRNISRLEELLAKSRADSLQISGYELDINDSSSVEATVPLMLDQMGSVDALVNNAGYGLWGCLEDLTETEVMEQVSDQRVCCATHEPGCIALDAREGQWHHRQRGVRLGTNRKPRRRSLLIDQVCIGWAEPCPQDGSRPIRGSSGPDRTWALPHQFPQELEHGQPSAGRAFPLLQLHTKDQGTFGRRATLGR